MTAWRWSGIAAALLAATAAFADGLADNVVAQLQEQGYTKITIGRTLLGRIRILGSSAEGQREIVLNPNTGEILRDYLRPTYATTDDGGSNEAPRAIVSRDPETAEAETGDDAGGSEGEGGSKIVEGGKGDPAGTEDATGDEGPDPADTGSSGKSTEGGETLPGVVDPATPDDPAPDPVTE